jgi:transposase
MFVRVVSKDKNHVSIRIVENHRVDGKVKQKTICCVGHLKKDDIEKIEIHKRIAEEMIVKIKNEINPALPGMEEILHAPRKRNPIDEDMANIKSLEEEARINIGIDDIFGHAYDLLNLENAIETGYKQNEASALLKEMTLSRISNPVSKRMSVRNIQQEKNISLNLDKVYRMMDKVFENQEGIKEKIRSSTLNLLNQKVDVAFFDVTTLYFESFSPDELRNFGFSKDNKFKETQVMLALITTTEGLPLGYELFPGNTCEGNTLIRVIEEIEKRYTLSNTFIVADRAMFTKSNLSKLDEKKVKFVIAAKLRSMKMEMKEKFVGDVILTKESSENLEHFTKDYEYEGRRLVVSYSKKRADKDKKDRERLVERIKKKMKDGKVRLSDLINNTGTKKYLKLEKKGAKEATLNESKIEEDAKWDGIHGVITNHDTNDLSSEEILKKYKGLWQIEAAFRVNKHDLKMRPIFHWSPQRVKAHVLICFMAYSLVAFIRFKLNQKNIKLSFQEIQNELSRLEMSIVKDKKTGKRFILPSKITATQQSIYRALGLVIDSKVRLLQD